MGAGKSTVGARLAELLRWRFVDLDTEIVKREGRSIAEIFRAVGEPEFRRIESAALQSTLRDEASPAVIALGGGTFIQAANRDLLRSNKAIIVYLQADFDLLLARCCVEEGTRPLMQDPAAFRQLFEQRQPAYRLADITIAVAGRSAEEIAFEIASQVEQQNASPAVPE
jgi:shikimate kinase